MHTWAGGIGCQSKWECNVPLMLSPLIMAWSKIHYIDLQKEHIGIAGGGLFFGLVLFCFVFPWIYLLYRSCSGNRRVVQWDLFLLCLWTWALEIWVLCQTFSICDDFWWKEIAFTKKRFWEGAFNSYEVQENFTDGSLLNTRASVSWYWDAQIIPQMINCFITNQ